MGRARTVAALSVMAVLCGVTTLLSRKAAGAEPTTAECLAVYEDSINLRKSHQLRATRAKLLTCSSESCPAEVRAECIARVREIDVSLPTVVFEARDASGTDLVAVKVKVDGELLAERLQGSALPIDPGEHTFTFEAAGRPIVEKRLLILEGEKLRRERVEFEAIAAPKPVTPPPAVVVKPQGLEQPSPSPAAKAPLGKARTLALALGGVGLAATGVGVAYGLIARSRRDSARNACPTDPCEDQPGVDSWSRAYSAGNISTGAFVIGAAGIASGAVVWLLAKPSPESGGPQISLGPGGLQVLGKW